MAAVMLAVMLAVILGFGVWVCLCDCEAPGLARHRVRGWAGVLVGRRWQWVVTGGSRPRKDSPPSYADLQWCFLRGGVMRKILVMVLVVCGWSVVGFGQGDNAGRATTEQAAVKGKLRTGVTISATPDKRAYFLGENVLVHYEVKNGSDAALELERDSMWRAIRRSSWFLVTAVNEQGEVAADPTPEINRGEERESEKVKLAAGESFFEYVPVTRYRRFEKPGKYLVWVFNDLGWGPDGTLSPSGKPGALTVMENDLRWKSVEVEIKMPGPEDIKRVAEAMTGERDWRWRAGEKMKAYPDARCLGYDFYLPELKRLAEVGNVAAFEGLAEIETAESTWVMIAGLKSDKQWVPAAAFEALKGRMAQPVYAGVLYPKGAWPEPVDMTIQRKMEAAWRKEMEAPVLAFAREAIADHRKRADGFDKVGAGAWIIQVFGTTEDLAQVAEALGRCIDPAPADAKDAKAEPAKGIVELEKAVEVLIAKGAKPVAEPKSSGEIAVWLLRANRAWSMKLAPVDLGDRLKEWINHPSAYIQCASMQALPVGFSKVPWASKAVMQKLGARETQVRKTGVFVAGQSKDGVFGPRLMELIRKDADREVANAAMWGALEVGVNRDEVYLAWADRLELESLDAMGYLDCLSRMRKLVGAEWSFYGARSDDKPPLMEVRSQEKGKWVAFIKANREAIRVGKVFKKGDKEVPEELVR
jgi:hypothetical protein